MDTPQDDIQQLDPPESQSIDEMVAAPQESPPERSPAPAPAFDPATIDQPKGWIEALKRNPDLATEVPVDHAEELYRDQETFRRLPQRAREEIYDTLLVARDVDLEDARSSSSPTPQTTNIPELAYQQGMQQARAHYQQLFQAARDLQQLEAELQGDRYDGNWREFSKHEPDKARAYRELESFVQNGDRDLGNQDSWSATPASLIQAELNMVEPAIAQKIVEKLPPLLRQKTYLTWDDYKIVRDMAIETMVEARVGARGAPKAEEKPKAMSRAERIREAQLQKRKTLPRPDASGGRSSTNGRNWDSYIDLNASFGEAISEDARRLGVR